MDRRRLQRWWVWPEPSTAHDRIESGGGGGARGDRAVASGCDGDDFGTDAVPYDGGGDVAVDEAAVDA